MTKSILKLGMIAAILGAGSVLAAEPAPAAASAPPGAAVKDCTGLATAARKECEKVATQMDQTAQGNAPPPPSGTAPDAPASTKQHHSSPIMQTPEQKVAAKAVEKGQDPKKAIEKLHAKEGQPN